MDYIKRIKSMSDEELKKETYALHEIVHITECFGIADVAMLEACKNELKLRGYKLDVKPVLSIEK